jgi:SAM-dependent methyltransferase
MIAELQLGHPHPGGSTATPGNVAYRLGKIGRLGLLKGRWLDYGCADGGYSRALAERVEYVVGVDTDPERIAAANRDHPTNTEFRTCVGTLPFPDHHFDCVLVNEVLEHVDSEADSLREIRRVLKPAGHLVVMSPNRWFPFEGHGMRIGNRSFGFPIPLLPWLPRSISMPVMAARNYWPHELSKIIRNAGFTVERVDFVLPVLEMYPWLPARLIRLYRRAMPLIEHTFLRRFGVSTLIVASERKAA